MAHIIFMDNTVKPDELAINSNINRYLSESLTLTDSIAKNVPVSISESLLFTTDVKESKTVSPSETLGFSDALSKQSALSASISESLDFLLLDDEIIDTDGNSANGVTSVSLGGTGIDIEFDPVNGRMYVAIQSREWIEVIDTNTYSLIDTNGAGSGTHISMGSRPYALEYDPVNERMYAVLTSVDQVKVIDTSDYSILQTINVGDSPEDIAYDSANQRMYVTNNADQTVSVIDTSDYSIESTIAVDFGSIYNKPEKITYDSTNQQMFFSFPNGYGYIDTNASSGNYQTAQDGEGSTGTYDIEYDSANDKVFLSRYLGDGGLGVIDTSSYGAVSTLTTGKTYQMKFVSELDRLYYSYGSDLRILDTNSDSVIKTISSVRSNDFSL